MRLANPQIADDSRSDVRAGLLMSIRSCGSAEVDETRHAKKPRGPCSLRGFFVWRYHRSGLQPARCTSGNYMPMPPMPPMPPMSGMPPPAPASSLGASAIMHSVVSSHHCAHVVVDAPPGHATQGREGSGVGIIQSNWKASPSSNFNGTNALMSLPASARQARM